MDKYDKSRGVRYTLLGKHGYGEGIRGAHVPVVVDSGRSYRTTVRTELGEESAYSELWIQYSNFERDINR